MKKKLACLLLLASVMLPAQQTTQRYTGTVSTSGGFVAFDNSLVGGINSSFEVIVNGAPATLTITTQGCMVGGTCDTLDTYTTVANSVRKPTIAAPYDFFKITASWTGGTNPSVQVNARTTLARSGAGSGIQSINGDTTSAQVITSNAAGTDVAVATAAGTTTISVPTASSSVRGALAAADWTLFNGKQAALSTSGAVANQFVTGFTAPNTFTRRQPVCADLSDSGAGCSSAAGGVTSFNSRTGAVSPTSGDYTAALVTNALDTSTLRVANTVLAGPSSGGNAAPTFRALVSADLPAGTGTVSSVGLTMPGDFSVANSPVTGSATLAATRTTETVAFSATPTFNCKARETITLTGNVTSSTLTGCTTVGQYVTFIVIQDGTGGRTIVFPTNVLNASPPTATASVTTYQTFTWDGTNLNPIGPSIDSNGAVTFPGPGAARTVAEGAKPGAPTAGNDNDFGLTNVGICQQDSGAAVRCPAGKVNAQTGTSYAIASTDWGKLVTQSNSGASAYTIAQAGSTYPSGWFTFLMNTGAGTETLTPTTSTIDGASTLVLTQGQSALVFSDGTNYRALRGGVGALAAVTSKWVNAISAAGVASATQPACGDLSNSAASCSTDTTNAANITSGTLPNARISGLPNANLANSSITINTTAPVTGGATPALGGSITVACATCATTTNGGALSGTAPIAVSAAGVISGGGLGSVTGALKGNGSGTITQAACADLSNAAASCSTDTTNAANIASGTLPAGRMPALTGDVTTSAGAVATSLAPNLLKSSCAAGLGDGLNAIAAGTYLQTTCYNNTGQTITITGIKCFTDNNGTSTLNVTDNSANGLLTGAVTCTNSYAAGTQSATTTIASGGYFKFTFVADGTSKQTDWEIAYNRAR